MPRLYPASMSKLDKLRDIYGYHHPQVIAASSGSDLRSYLYSPGALPRRVCGEQDAINLAQYYARAAWDQYDRRDYHKRVYSLGESNFTLLILGQAKKFAAYSMAINKLYLDSQLSLQYPPVF